ncbi:MAG: cytochrome c [Vicinamibacterales bacterium]
MSAVRPVSWVLVVCAVMAVGCDPAARPAEGTAAAGRALYGENGCASCHGPSGRGDGPVGKTLAIPPRDFKDAQSFRNGRDEMSIAATLAAGIDRNGAKMPAFNHLSESERRALALFVLSLGDAN